MTTPLLEYLHSVPRGAGFGWRYLTVDALAGEIPWSEEDCLQRAHLTTADAGDLLTPNGVLAVCVRWCKPFREAEPDDIYDIRSRLSLIKRKRRCQAYGLLVGNIANLLMQYDRKRLQAQDLYLGNRGKLAYAWGMIDHAVEDFCKLRQQGISPTNPSLKGVRADSLRETLSTLFAIVQWLNSEECLEALFASVHPLYRRLVQTLHQAFTRYGPEKWPDAAIIAAMACILTTFGLTNSRGGRITPSSILKELSRYEHVTPLVRRSRPV